MLPPRIRGASLNLPPAFSSVRSGSVHLQDSAYGPALRSLTPRPPLRNRRGGEQQERQMCFLPSPVGRGGRGCTREGGTGASPRSTLNGCPSGPHRFRAYNKACSRSSTAKLPAGSSQPLSPCRRSPLAEGTEARDVLGVAHAAGKYNFTDEDFLNEGADRILELGGRVIKIFLVPRTVRAPTPSTPTGRLPRRT